MVRHVRGRFLGITPAQRYFRSNCCENGQQCPHGLVCAVRTQVLKCVQKVPWETKPRPALYTDQSGLPHEGIDILSLYAAHSQNSGSTGGGPSRTSSASTHGWLRNPTHTLRA